MSAGDFAEGNRNDQGEAADKRRGVGLGAVIACSTIAAVSGAGLGAVATRAPETARLLDSVAPSDARVLVASANQLTAQRLAEIEARFQQVETASASAESAIVAGKLAALQQTVTSLQGRIGEADYTAIAREVAALRADTDTIRKQSESAATAARAAFAVAAAAEAARASGPFEPAFATLEAILPGDPNVMALAPLARTGAPSRQELKDLFEDMQEKIVRAARISTAGAGFWGRVQIFLAQFVTIQRSGESDTPVGMVERAAARLEGDDVAGAVAEMSRLTGPAAQVASPWLRQARARLEIDARLAAIRVELSRGRSS